MSDYELQLERIVRLLEEGNLNEVATLCGSLIDSPAHDGRARHIAAVARLRRGDVAGAVQMLSEAARERPSDPAVHNSLGEALRQSGDEAQAEARFRFAIHLDRAFAAAHANLGLLLWRRGDLEDAALCFRNVLVIEPDNATALRSLGTVLCEDGRVTEALTHLRKAVEVSPGDYASRMALADALRRSGDTRAALESYTMAAALDGAQGAAHFGAACAASELCHEEEACLHASRLFRDTAAFNAVENPEAVSARLGNISALDEFDAVVRVARSQWHNVAASPAVLHAGEGEAPVQPMTPFSGEIFVARLAPGRVLPVELLPMDDRGTLFLYHVVSQPLRRPYTSRFILHACDDGRLLMAVPSRRRELNGDAVLLGAAPSHVEWVHECLTRLWALEQRPELKDMPLVVQAGLTPWQKELLALLGYGADRLIEAHPEQTLVCQRLHVPSLASHGDFVAPAAVEHLRRKLRPVVPKAADTPRRVYFSRGGLGTRRLLNEEELVHRLARHGFTSIEPHRLGAAEQLAILQHAEAVVGVEGAAMAHLFFAPPRAKVGVIVAEGLQSTRYFGPSAVLGQDFRLLLAVPDFASHGEHRECDLTLDIGVLEGFLASLPT